MIGDYLVVALVFGIVVSYVAIIHHFWLRDAFKEEAPLNVSAKREGTCEIYSVLSESSSKADCQNFPFATQASSRSQRNNREPFDPGATTLVGRKPKSEKKGFLQKRMPALSQTQVSGRS